MGEHQKVGDDSGGQTPEGRPSRGKPDPGGIFNRVIQLLTALAVAAHEVSTLIGR
jgi:hypothetical protein